jgi:hypothetical protein
VNSDSHATHTPIHRQAVVIIHGIGEQRPLGPLKSFVRSFRPEGTFYSKPERLTTSFEARRMKLRKLQEQEEGENWIETDFYEYYWAHMMFGARWRHFIAWTGRVLARGWRAAGTNDSTGRRLHNARALTARRWVVASLGAFILIAVVLLMNFGPLAMAGVAMAMIAPTRVLGGPDGYRLRFNGLKLHTRYWPRFPNHIPELIEILKWQPTDG